MRSEKKAAERGLPFRVLTGFLHHKSAKSSDNAALLRQMNNRVRST
jgi:hypothetical protein